MASLSETDLNSIWKNVEQYENQELLEKENRKQKNIKCLCEETPEIVERNGDLICDNCGLIMQTFNISLEAEWRNFNNENGMDNSGERVGNPVDNLIPQTSMSTIMSGGNTRMKNLNMWLSIPYKEKILLNIRARVTQVVNNNKMSTYLISQTVKLYNKFSSINENCFRGKNREAFICVCFYYASKDLNFSIPYICSCFGVDKNIFSKCCKIYNECMVNCDNTNINSQELLDRFANQLNISFHIKKLAKSILLACERLSIFPTAGIQTLISAVLYFVNTEMQLNMNKDDIANVCNVSQTSMIKFCKAMAKEKIKIFNYVKANK